MTKSLSADYGTLGMSSMLSFDKGEVHQPVPKKQILNSSKLKHDNFRFDEYGRKSSKCVGNAVSRKEIACYEQFLFFP